MKSLVTLALAAGLGLAGTASAGAANLQVQVPPSEGIVKVEGGCGPYGHRDYYGYCRPNVRYVAPYRGCPPYFHPTPYGCRRNY